MATHSDRGQCTTSRYPLVNIMAFLRSQSPEEPAATSDLIR